MGYVLVYRVLDVLFQALYLALLCRVLLSWVPHDRYNTIIQYLYQITDPILQPFQNIVPAHRFGIDLSPIFAFIAIAVVRDLVFRLLF